MAVKIPDFTALGFDSPRASTGLPRYPAESPEAAGVAAFGAGLSRIGMAVGNIVEADRQRQNQINAALAEADLSANLFRTKEAIKNERDPEKVDALKAQLPAFLNRAEATITDPEYRQLWSAKARIKIVEAEGAADQQQRSIYKDRFLAGASSQLDEQVKIAAQAADPAEREAAKRNIGNIIGSMEAAGVIGAAKAQELAQGYGQDIISGHANWLDANGQSTAAWAFLQQNSRALDPGKYRQMTDHLRPRVDKEAGLGLVDRTAPGTMPVGRNAIVEAARLAMQDQESGGRYNLLHKPTAKGDQALGAYGFLDRYLADDSRRYYGREVSKEEFLKSPEIQDTMFRNKFGRLVDKYGVAGAARAWFAGEGGMNDRARMDTTSGINVGQYEQKFLARFAKRGGAAGGDDGRVTDPALAAEIDAAPAVGEPIPLDQSPAPQGPPDWRAWVDRINADPNTTREQKDAAIAEVHRRQNQLELGQEQAKSDLFLGIMRGEKTAADVEDLYRQQKISPAARTQAHAIFQKQEDERKAIADAVTRVNAAGSGGPPLDPKAKGDRDALNVHYDAISRGWADKTPEDRLTLSVNYAVQYGLVPDPLKAVIRGGLHSGRPDQAVLAADTIERLRLANPLLVGDIGDENDLRLATLIRSNTTKGMAPEVAVKSAVDSLKVDKTMRDARGEEFDTLRGKTERDRVSADKRWIESKQNSIWSIDPTVDEVMRAEFDALAKDEFTKTGDLETARTRALDTINRVWGRTRVGLGGNVRYMRQAPEKFYGVPTLSPDQNSAWMTEQLVEDVKRNAVAGAPITSDRLLVVPSASQAPDGRPAYEVMLNGPNGYERVFRWVPNWESSPEFKRRKEGVAKTIQQLRDERLNPKPPLDFMFRGGATLQEQMGRGAGEMP